MTALAAILEISNLTVRFKSHGSTVHAINGVNMTIPAGRAVAIVGESGSGKSTCMAAVPRLLPVNAQVDGTITFAGRNLMALKEREIRKVRGREIAMIFQNPTSALNPIKTVGQQLIEPLLYHHLASAATAREQAIALLTRVGIPDATDRFHMYPFEFSGGMLQRVMIAMALMAKPKLLIADEPTTALDVTVQAEILVLLKRLQLEHGMSLVFITHDLAVAAQLCDEIYVMYGGLVMEHVHARDLVAAARHPYLRGLMASIPNLDGPTRERLPFIPGQPLRTTQPLQPGCTFADRCLHRMDRCSVRPPLDAVVTGHEVACWLAQVEVGS